MTDRYADIISLHQGEGRTGHLKIGIAGIGANQCAGERGLAGAKIAGKRQHVARAQGRRQVLAKPRRRSLVRQQPFHGVIGHETFYHSAAARTPAGTKGKRQVTVVPAPALVAMPTLPP